MEEQAPLFSDPEKFMAEADEVFALVARNLNQVLQNGIEDTERSYANLRLPLRLTHALWTRMAWQDIQEVLASQDEEAIGYVVGQAEEDCPGIWEILQSYDRDDLDITEWPLHPSGMSFIDYYIGFEKLNGWKAFSKTVEDTHLSMSAFLSPAPDGHLDFNLQIRAPDEQPLLEYVTFMGHAPPALNC